ncbi:HAD hydrolase-like protein [Luteimonas sp. Y-2-2-4F]|nr:HAD hydrolase-like protein [Luteimonas sp. Y-2-2-4F]
MSRDTLFFDLDGTLVDSEAGILGGIAHALAEMGEPALPREALLGWIGPPMADSFDRLFAGDAARTRRALALYRERYDRQGWREVRAYPGIGDAVEALRAAGHRLAVATSKSERFARRIVDALPFGAAFETVVGASEDGSRRYKDALIAEALARLSLAPAACRMIGDRRMDIEGARQHGMRSIGVLWGFGGEAELRAAGADALAAAPAELAGLVA